VCQRHASIVLARGTVLMLPSGPCSFLSGPDGGHVHEPLYREEPLNSVNSALLPGDGDEADPYGAARPDR